MCGESVHRDGDIALLMPKLNIAMSLNDLVKRIAPVGNGFDEAGFNEIPDSVQTIGAAHERPIIDGGIQHHANIGVPVRFQGKKPL